MEDDKQVGGVQIILERMKTHPEDFVSPTIQSRRWINLYEMALSEDIATADEVLALHQGMKNARRTMFTERVLKTLAEGDAPLEAETIPSHSSQRTGTVLGGATLGGLSGLSNAISNGGTVTLNPAQNAYQNHLVHQQAHLAQQAQSTQSVIEQGLSNYWQNQSYSNGFTTDDTPNTEFIKKLKAKLFKEAN